eukprot:scaffold28973_cov137-Amphora_coffeaeformis.AAC.1
MKSRLQSEPCNTKDDRLKEEEEEETETKSETDSKSVAVDGRWCVTPEPIKYDWMETVYGTPP